MGYDADEWSDHVEPHVVRADPQDAGSTFTVPGRPVPKARPRVNTETGQAYTDDRTRSYEARVAMYAQREGVRCHEGDVELRVELYFEQENYGDIDNYAKALLDGCQGIAYDNDKQVRRLTVERYEGEPRAVVSVRAMEE